MDGAVDNSPLPRGCGNLWTTRQVVHRPPPSCPQFPPQAVRRPGERGRGFSTVSTAPTIEGGSLLNSDISRPPSLRDWNPLEAQGSRKGAERGERQEGRKPKERKPEERKPEERKPEERRREKRKSGSDRAEGPERRERQIGTAAERTRKGGTARRAAPSPSSRYGRGRRRTERTGEGEVASSGSRPVCCGRFEDRSVSP